MTSGGFKDLKHENTLLHNRGVTCCWSLGSSTIVPDRIRESSHSEMDLRLPTSPDSHANASKLVGVRHKRFDKTQQQVPLSAKLQVVSVGEEPLAFESKALNAPGKVTREEKASDSCPCVSLHQVFLCHGTLDLFFVSFFPCRPGVCGVCFGADS